MAVILPAILLVLRSKKTLRRLVLFRSYDNLIKVRIPWLIILSVFLKQLLLFDITYISGVVPLVRIIYKCFGRVFLERFRICILEVVYHVGRGVS